MKVSESYIDWVVSLALDEDIGSGDITTIALEPGDDIWEAELIFKSERGVLCGSRFFERAFQLLDVDAGFEWQFEDGDLIEGRSNVCRVRAMADTILTAERVALNFICHLSGIATNTRRYVDATKGKVRVLDTRKTTPLLRLAEKYAVRVGGGSNHRLGLYDGVLIKDNHIKIAGSVSRAVGLARKNSHHLLKIEVEVCDLKQVEEALSVNADVIMLDNFTEDEIARAVEIIGGRAGVELSGGVNLDNISRYADIGADYISIGALVHHATWVDFSLEVSGRVDIADN
ncbi:MAG: nicotinate-nucleotide diphosphorylase (carboxylating) [Candidatus Coatesbacteria bacterium 4484_99]|uniref:Probable nicotinate-nucleotide pyrophosphorylase [carboxylating] n=1 Tax=Candidatus Coatesbacteria bacterium 4484_99 TaxID=1970774 RepID=A0A1W9S391_9BACT|nr:MAG: nicotinate-nucleotide diphosphorylase (carboxylating) [Candidatus Coatesbacteria bacterium 4484_99]